MARINFSIVLSICDAAESASLGTRLAACTCWLPDFQSPWVDLSSKFADTAQVKSK